MSAIPAKLTSALGAMKWSACVFGLRLIPCQCPVGPSVVVQATARQQERTVPDLASG